MTNFMILFKHNAWFLLWRFVKRQGSNLKRRTLSKLGQLLIMKGRWGLWDFPEEKNSASDSQEWLHQAHQAVEPDDRVQADRPRERPSLAEDNRPRIQVTDFLLDASHQNYFWLRSCNLRHHCGLSICLQKFWLSLTNLNLRQSGLSNNFQFLWHKY